MILWIGFTILMSTFQKLDFFYYFIYNFWLLLFTYIHNYITPSRTSFNTFLLLSSFPSFVILYIILIYENFLLINLFNKHELEYKYYF